MAALNKFWRPLPLDEYLHRMDLPMVENAVTVAGFPKGIVDWVWEAKAKAGLVWKS